MITPTQLYWITRLDAIDRLLTVFTVATVISSLLMGLIGCLLVDDATNTDKIRNIGRRMIRWIPTAIVLAILLPIVNTFLPTTKEMAAIIVIPHVANSETVQQLGKGIVDLAHQWLVELAPKNGEEVRDGEM